MYVYILLHQMCMPTNQNTCNLYTIEFGTSDAGDPHMHSCIMKKTTQNRPSIECKGNEYQTLKESIPL